MKFDKGKLKQISRSMTQNESEEMNYRMENCDWLALSAKFALSVRHVLRLEKIPQKVLAARMGVSPAQVTKLLSGKENISLQTVAKVEKALGCSILDFQIDASSECPLAATRLYTLFDSHTDTAEWAHCYVMQEPTTEYLYPSPDFPA